MVYVLRNLFALAWSRESIPRYSAITIPGKLSCGTTDSVYRIASPLFPSSSSASRPNDLLQGLAHNPDQDLLEGPERPRFRFLHDCLEPHSLGRSEERRVGKECRS